jgi:hypothetical protein
LDAKAEESVGVGEVGAASNGIGQSDQTEPDRDVDGTTELERVSAFELNGLSSD